jgi:adenylosuccinate synthase
MPTELRDGQGEELRQRGKEYGTTTGRPRRCGWFDGVAARYANRINRFDTLCVTLLDVLDTFDEIRICVGYELGGRRVEGFPASCSEADSIRPVYETLEGWKRDTTRVRSWADLPDAARAYIERLGRVVGSEVGIVGVGPDRVQSIVKPGSWLARTVDL